VDDVLAPVLETLSARGLTLHERIATAAADGSPADEATAALLDGWRGRLAKVELWEERLATLGISEAEFYARAAAPAADPAPAAVRRAAETVRELLGLGAGGPLEQTRRYDDGLPPLPPAIERYVEGRVEAAVRSVRPLTPARYADLRAVVTQEVNFILAELHDFLLPTLVTELRVAAERGILDGETPEARFASFCRGCVRSREWLAEYLAAYPMAARHLHELVASRADAFRELLQRWEDDHADLAARGFLGADPAAALESLSPARGDRHRGGRTVRIVRLAGGGRVVYKPRPVAADVAFQELLAWLNARGFEPAMYVMPILAREHHGWFPFVAEEDCAGLQAVARFYRRHGAHVALLYLLGGYDFFSENVRARGEYPVLVDLECVHAPLMPAHNGRIFESAARRYLEESVLRAGVLPSWNWVYFGRDGVNLSPLTETAGQPAPIDALEWTGRGSDRLGQARGKRLVQGDNANLPTVGGVPMPVNDFLDDLFAGFRQAYAVVGRHRAELLAEGGPLRAFARAECRLVLRNTLDYTVLLQELRHPRYLSDALRHSECLDRLWLSRCPRYSPEVIGSEIAQLWRGDVPLFTVSGAGRDLHDDQGALVQRGYVAESALDGALRRLERWGPEDCERQAEIISCAFAITGKPHVSERTPFTRSLAGREEDGDPSTLDAPRLVAEACGIADQILSLAIEDEKTLTWIGLGMNRAGQWDQTSLDAGLYDGGPGIALLFLMLEQLTGNARYGGASAKILRYSCFEAARQVLDNRARLDDWVMYSPSSFVFPFASLYLGLQAQRFGTVEGADLLLDASLAWGEAGLGKRPRFDFLNGAAGVVRQLVVAWRVTGEPRALALARAYGDLLLRHAVPAGPGIGWAADPYPVPLGGFSHGASGIAWVLADLAAASGDERYADAARRALLFDRTLFSGDREEWYDLRNVPGEPGTAAQWCHGVSGIGLARALTWKHLADPALVRDAARAVDLTLAAEDSSDCLCHGTLGNLDCCAVAAEVTGNAEWAERVRRRASAVWNDAHARGHWQTGVPGRNLGVCGMFMGTAGIGYGLLRLARPDLVPSVLYLEEPKPVPAGK